MESEVCIKEHDVRKMDYIYELSDHFVQHKEYVAKTYRIGHGQLLNRIEDKVKGLFSDLAEDANNDIVDQSLAYNQCLREAVITHLNSNHILTTQMRDLTKAAIEFINNIED